MPPKPPNKTKTEPGLGHAGSNLPRIDSAEMKRVRDSFRREDPGPSPEAPGKRIRDSVRREDPDEPETSEPRLIAASERPAARRTASWEPEAPTGMRRKQKSGRPPVKVDDVGTAAVKLAQTSRRESAPKLLATRAMISKAPIDTRAAFVLSLVDGRNTVDAVVDMSGMPEEEVKPILQRLARIGLISLP